MLPDEWPIITKKWPTNDVIDNFIGQYIATRLKYALIVLYVLWYAVKEAFYANGAQSG